MQALAILTIIHVAWALTIDDRFDAFVARHGRRYANEAERSYRRSIFATSMRRSAELARANPKATFGDSPFADRTEDEWAQYLGRKPSTPAAPVRNAAPFQVSPSAMDWRTKGVVGPIKNQGQCGSCWAFSTIANIESQWALAGNKFVSLSEEQIVACDKFDTACNGGDTILAMQWIIFENGGGVASEAAYPYNPDDNTCRVTAPTARIEGYLNIERNENTMAQWCGTNGPVSICIDANSLQLYTSGILTQCPAKTINHCVAIVGYDTTSTPPYWIVRNSWGTAWGERGYFRLEMGHNLCGITSEPLSAMVTRPPPKSNVTFYHCTDSTCGSCKARPMEEGQCSDGGLSPSMIATCSGSQVSVAEFAEEGCDGRRLRDYNATQGACVTHGAGFYKITCQM